MNNFGISQYFLNSQTFFKLKNIYNSWAFLSIHEPFLKIHELFSISMNFFSSNFAGIWGNFGATESNFAVDCLSWLQIYPMPSKLATSSIGSNSGGIWGNF